MDHRNADLDAVCDAGFTEWLLQQQERPDRVGDLARDFAQDDTRSDARTLACLHGAAGRAFDEALRQYRTIAVFL